MVGSFRYYPYTKVLILFTYLKDEIKNKVVLAVELSVVSFREMVC